MPNLDLNNYPQDLRALINLVSDVDPVTAKRRQRPASVNMHDVVVSDGVNSVTMLLREGGLYIKGFRNANSTYYFKLPPEEQNPQAGGNYLSFTCSYVGTNSIGIYEEPDEVKNTDRQRPAVEEAIRKLSQFNGGTDNDMKVPLALMVMLISESIRFKYVANKMVRLCAYQSGYTFASVQDYVQNWKKMSTGEHVPIGTSIEQIMTYWG